MIEDTTQVVEPGDELLTIDEAAAIVRAPVATLRYWRHIGTGPRSLRVGRAVRYWVPKSCTGSNIRATTLRHPAEASSSLLVAYLRYAILGFVTTTLTAASLVRSVRAKSGLTQTELGTQAGVAQSVISAYESGHRQPSLPMLQRLVEAAGMELNLGVSPRRRIRFRGPVGSRLEANRTEVMAALKRHGVTNPRVFGSVARNEDTDDSDLDLLATLPKGMGLVALGRLQAELEEILGVPVDIVPERDLKPRVRARIEGDVVPL